MSYSSSKPDSAKLLGTRVKLLEAYFPVADAQRYGRDWNGYQFGIVVDNRFLKGSRNPPEHRPKHVSLHLFDSEGRIYLVGTRSDGIPLPGFVDFHADDILLCTDNMTPII